MLANLPSRAELLTWVSDLTKTKVEKLEQLSDAIQFCQIFDIIYPKVVNLNRLKKDAKGSLEKEKNFRVLLNAISQLQLKVTINIMDLASGKVTAILELLQWMWKEHQRPSLHIDKKDGKDNKDFEPRMIKSYVGKLVTRPNFSLAKGNEKSEATRSNGSARRSLDARLSSIPKTQKSDRSVKTAINPIQPIQQRSARMEESEVREKVSMKAGSDKKAESQKLCLSESINPKEKNLDISQTKDLTVFLNQSEKLEKQSEKEVKNSVTSSKIHSKILILNDDPESMNKLCSEKKEYYKKLKAEKDSARNKKETNISEILDSTLSLDREKLCQKLIKVTGAVLQSNPELESKLKRLLQSQEASSSEKPACLNKSYEEDQSLQSSHQNNSLKCETDMPSAQDVEIDGPSINQNEENNRREVIVVEPPKISNNPIFANMKVDNPEKIKLFEKQASLQKDPSAGHQKMLPPQVIKQISNQKDKAKRNDEEKKEKLEKASKRMPMPNFQNPISIFSRGNLPFPVTEFFTQKKNEPIAKQLFGSKKEPQSDNPNIYRIYSNTQNDERQNEQNCQKEANQPQPINSAQNEKKEQEVEYPELEPYTSVTAPKQ